MAVNDPFACLVKSKIWVNKIAGRISINDHIYQLADIKDFRTEMCQYLKFSRGRGPQLNNSHATRPELNPFRTDIGQQPKTEHLSKNTSPERRWS